MGCAWSVPARARARGDPAGLTMVPGHHSSSGDRQHCAPTMASRTALNANRGGPMGEGGARLRAHPFAILSRNGRPGSVESRRTARLQQARPHCVGRINQSSEVTLVPRIEGDHEFSVTAITAVTVLRLSPP